jgi:predicted ATP-grasp superfamily ATP-dependent carboligase
MYGLPGAVLLGETGEIYVAGNLMDYLAVASVLEAISKIANIELDTRELFRKGEELEEKITTQALREIETEEKPSAPTHL